MRRFLSGLLMLLSCSLASAQPQPGPEAEILKTDAAYREAVMHADVKTLATIMKEDIVIVHSDGTTDNRSNFLNAIASGRLRLQAYERSNVSVHIDGTTAVLLSRSRKKFTYKGSPAQDDDTSLVTYIKTPAGWRMIAMQNTHATN